MLYISQTIVSINLVRLFTVKIMFRMTPGRNLALKRPSAPKVGHIVPYCSSAPKVGHFVYVAHRI